MKRHYDLIISLGAACSCTQMLRLSNLQLNTYPLDWVSGATFPQRVEFFLSGFANYLNKEDFTSLNVTSNTSNEVYLNNRTLIKFPHDFPAGKSMDDIYPKVAEKYSRRIKRLFELIESSNSVLFVYMETPSCSSVRASKEEITESFQRIVDKYPTKDINLRYITYCKEYPSEKFSMEEINEHITLITGEYKSKKTNAKDYSVNKSVCKRFVRDCRLNMPFLTRCKRWLLRQGRLLIPVRSLRRKYCRHFHIYTHGHS